MAQHTAAGLTDEQVQAAFDEAEGDSDATVEVILPAGSGSWNAQVTYDAPATATNVIIRGAGIAATTITDDFSNGSDLLVISIPDDCRFRWYDMKFVAGVSWTAKNEWLQVSGDTANFRVHHIHLDGATNSANMQKCFAFHGWLRGVVDHCIFDYDANGGPFFLTYAGAGGGVGFADYLWAQPTGRGGSDYLFFEDNVVTAVSNSAVEDSTYSAKWVARFNVGTNTWFQTHPTVDGASGRARGSRSLEIYCNDMTDTTGGPLERLLFLSSGTALMWNNPIAEGFKHVIKFINMRRIGNSFGGTYNSTATPNGWGYAGPARASGTVNTSGTTVTKTAGDNFNTSWSDSMIFIDGTGFYISSVDSTTQITLTTSAGSNTGVSYVVGSNWDGNQDFTGYPTIDQPGRGEGDLLLQDFPNAINSDNGNAGHDSADAWPRQALEPVYIWDIDWTIPGGSGGSFVNDTLAYGTMTENVDYYLEDASFDGTTGIGVGTRAAMDAIGTPTDGVGFWVTNEGSWNAGSNAFYTGQGRLYVASGGDWVLHYEPYTYPHPLVTADNPTTRRVKKGKVSRGRH